MIVKNEAAVIARSLDSVRSIIDYWIIVDTGSTDGTQDIIRAHFRTIPGALHERPWRDFASNRSEALVLASSHCDYTLVMDADDELEVSEHFIMPELDADCYAFDIDLNGVRYRRPQLIKSSLPWRYEGVLHEYLVCNVSATHGHLPLTVRIHHDGARRRDPLTYARDAEILEAALAKETDAFRAARYTFYLAQSYRDSGQTEKAIEYYLRRTKLGFWIEEIFMSFYMAAQLCEGQNEATERVLTLYDEATRTCPHRAEAAYRASRLCRLRSDFGRGYEIAKRARGLGPPEDSLFVETWIYDYGLLDEFAVNAYWSERYKDCAEAILTALSRGKVPSHEQLRFVQNAQFALEKWPSTAAAPL
jgi:glycosyltransferase involved in cell wall biosynthesis